MTFIISDEDGKREIKNTKDTRARFNKGGQVNFNAEFDNSGTVEIDIMANVNFLEKVTNSGSFNIKDYITESHYSLIEQAIAESEGEPKELLTKVYSAIKENDDEAANSWFKKLIKSLKSPTTIASTAMSSAVSLIMKLFE